MAYEIVKVRQNTYETYADGQERAARGTTVTIRPLAGTRPRGATPEADKALAKELLEDPKEIAEHVMHGFAELCELEREPALSVLGDLTAIVELHGSVELAEDAADARVGVEQVGCSIAFERQHAVPVEDVVAVAVLAEVGVLDGADPHGTRYVVVFCRV